MRMRATLLFYRFFFIFLSFSLEHAHTPTVPHVYMYFAHSVSFSAVFTSIHIHMFGSKQCKCRKCAYRCLNVVTSTATSTSLPFVQTCKLYPIACVLTLSHTHTLAPRGVVHTYNKPYTNRCVCLCVHVVAYITHSIHLLLFLFSR